VYDTLAPITVTATPNTPTSSRVVLVAIVRSLYFAVTPRRYLDRASRLTPSSRHFA
jgi:hypothetical protein